MKLGPVGFQTAEFNLLALCRLVVFASKELVVNVRAYTELYSG